MRRQKPKFEDQSWLARPLWHMCAFIVVASMVMLPCISVAEELSSDASVTPQGDSAAMVSTFYATNRGRDAKTLGQVAYNGDRGEPRYGSCLVAFSPIPLVKDLGSIAPFYLPRETNRISIVEQSDQQTFWNELVAAADRTTSRSIILFVHGYNYGFKRTCRMAAELQRTLYGKATVVMLSWPSNALPTDYLPDQVDIEWSVPFLANFVSDLADRVGPKRVQVLAHSMGSRGVLFALQRLGADSQERPVINKLVLLAPDFDSETFVDLLPRLTPLVSNLTLYASSNDTALMASRKLNGNPRLGEAGKFLTVVKGIETIDVSPVGRHQILGHEYFYYHPGVVADLVKLLSSGARAAERSTLRTQQRGGISYWEIVEGAPPQ